MSMSEARIAKWLRMSLLCLMTVSLVSMSFMTGCPSTTPGEQGPGDSGTPDSTSGTCTKNEECPQGQACSGGSCKQGCTDNSGCAAGQKCEGNVCVADTGGCASDTECPPGQVCKSGKCEQDATGQEPKSVEIVEAGGVLRQGQTLQLTARALNASGATITGDFKFQWSSSDTDVATIDASTGLVTGGSKDGEADITVKLDALTSTPIKVRNFAAVEAGKARVIVVDGDKKPVAGATVKVGDKEGTTDASGAATIDGVTPPFDVHVFHQDYNYVSAFGTSKADLFVQVTTAPDTSKAGGGKGTFDFEQIKTIFGISDDDWGEYAVGFGIAGMSLSDNLLSLNFDLLIGESFKVNLFGQDLSLPSGIVVALASGGKPDFQSLGEAGKKLLWGFGGKFKLEEVTPIISGATGGEINVASLLASAKPLLARMAFGFRPDVQITLFPRVADTEDKNDNGKTDDMIPDFDKFPTYKLILNKKLDKTIGVTISSYPKVTHNGKAVDLLAIGLAGKLVPGIGLVPLGLDVDQAKGDSGSLSVKYAATEGVLNTGKFAALVLALTIPLGDDPAPLTIFGEVKVGDSAPSSMTVSSFLSLPEGAKYDPAGRKLESANTTGATVTQFDIDGKDGKKWTIYFGAGANGTVTLPAVPSGMADVAADATSASLRPVKLTDGQTLDSVLEFNSINMDGLVNVISSFASVEIYKK